MRPIFIDRHRLRGAGIHLGTTTRDRLIPRLCGIRISTGVEAADQFEREAGALLFGQTKSLASMSVGDMRSVLAAGDRVVSRGLSVVCQSADCLLRRFGVFAKDSSPATTCDPLVRDQTQI